jgi:hypothetical protein
MRTGAMPPVRIPGHPSSRFERALRLRSRRATPFSLALPQGGGAGSGLRGRDDTTTLKQMKGERRGAQRAEAGAAGHAHTHRGGKICKVLPPAHQKCGCCWVGAEQPRGPRASRRALGAEARPRRLSKQNAAAAGGGGGGGSAGGPKKAGLHPGAYARQGAVGPSGREGPTEPRGRRYGPHCPGHAQSSRLAFDWPVKLWSERSGAQKAGLAKRGAQKGPDRERSRWPPPHANACTVVRGVHGRRAAAWRANAQRALDMQPAGGRRPSKRGRPTAAAAGCRVQTSAAERQAQRRRPPRPGFLAFSEEAGERKAAAREPLPKAKLGPTFGGGAPWGGGRVTGRNRRGGGRWGSRDSPGWRRPRRGARWAGIGAPSSHCTSWGGWGEEGGGEGVCRGGGGRRGFRRAPTLPRRPRAGRHVRSMHAAGPPLSAARRRADLAGPGDLVGVLCDHFAPVGYPAGRARDREDHREPGRGEGTKAGREGAEGAELLGRRGAQARQRPPARARRRACAPRCTRAAAGPGRGRRQRGAAAGARAARGRAPRPAPAHGARTHMDVGMPSARSTMPE